jgi:repressor of nif and glnA expression
MLDMKQLVEEALNAGVNLTIKFLKKLKFGTRQNAFSYIVSHIASQRHTTIFMR